MKKVLIYLGIHGKRHRESGYFLNVKHYLELYKAREKALIKWCADNGLGSAIN